MNAIHNGLNRLKALVENIVDDPQKVIDELDTDHKRIEQAILEMPVDNPVTVTQQTGAIEYKGFAPEVEVDQALPSGWVRKPDIAELIFGVMRSLQELVRKAESENEMLDEFERGSLIVVLETALKLLEEDCPMVDHRILTWIHSWAQSKAGEIMSKQADNALGYLFGKVAEEVGNLLKEIPG